MYLCIFSQLQVKQEQFYNAEADKIAASGAMRIREGQMLMRCESCPREYAIMFMTWLPVAQLYQELNLSTTMTSAPSPTGLTLRVALVACDTFAIPQRNREAA
jgi:hypothetical protein